MQNYFGQAIRNNSGEMEQMKKDIWAIFYHLIEDDKKTLEEQHQSCPQDENTWCKFRLDKHNNTASYNNASRLPVAFIAELKPIFERLSNDNLLDRCLSGLTQNQNESINGLLWLHCPKTKFCGKSRVELAVAETTCEFNEGAGCKAVLLDAMNVSISANLLRGLRKEDTRRENNAKRKIKMTTCESRRKLHAKRKSKISDEQPVLYKTGMFGISARSKFLITWYK